MVEIFVEYLGDLHCKVKHGPSGQEFLTDAPLDNEGKAEFISPTDLLATASASCITTIMGIVARNNNIDIVGLKVKATKEMVNHPYRRISKLTIDFVFPKELNEKEFQLMSNVVKTCPVTRSLSPDVELEVHFKVPGRDLI
ncbi:MAG TPA: OsmC family protein [Candidatus Kapabacteria bacterium]|nr:OsmC family protein [Candidatus Kapabacteria bacterium]